MQPHDDHCRVHAATHQHGPARPGQPVRACVAARWPAPPALLYGVALVARLFATALFNFPMTEGSAYDVAVARNLVARPRPRDRRDMELCHAAARAAPTGVRARQPLASAGRGRTDGDPGCHVRCGADRLSRCSGPCWRHSPGCVARDASRRAGLPSRRANDTVAIGAGLLVAVTGPLVLSSAIPDSTLPFTVLGVAACLPMPARRHAVSRGALIGLGLVLACSAYPTRMEAVWLGLAFVVMVLARRGADGARPCRGSPP